MNICRSQAISRLSSSRRGFNLVESAIVLGVVGLVIGGIWVAASTVSANMKESNTAKDVLQIVSGIQNLYHGQAPAADGNITVAMINAGVVPRDLVSGNTITNRWGSSIKMELEFSTYPSTTRNISIYLGLIPFSACINLTMKLSTSAGLAMIEAIDGSTYSTELTTFPVSLQDATAACQNGPASAMRQMVLLYSIR